MERYYHKHWLGTWIMGTLLFLATRDALACSMCWSEQLARSAFFEKMFIIKLAVAVSITAARLDPFRVFLAYGGYVAVFIQLEKALMTHRIDSDHSLIQTLLNFALGVGVLDIAMLALMGRQRFFRREEDSGLEFTHFALYLTSTWLLLTYFV